mgnify:CR=1 FL=1
MKASSLSSLNDFRVKKTALIFTIIFGTLQVLMSVFQLYEGDPIRKFMNFIILLTLLMAVYSKEKLDDERVQQVRYFSLKMSFYVLIIFLGFNYFAGFGISAIYVGIGSLLFYLIVFYLGLFFNPAFIFIEKTNRSKIQRINLKVFRVVCSVIAVLIALAILTNFFK